MMTILKVGDFGRITEIYGENTPDETRRSYEGVVTAVNGSCYSLGRDYTEAVAYREDYVDDRLRVEVEKLTPPLPTTPGSAIRISSPSGGSDRTLVLGRDGCWWHEGLTCAPVNFSDVEIIYTAP
jgi:hypothetical protein